MTKEFNPFIIEFDDQEARVILQNVSDDFKYNIVVFTSSNDTVARDFCNHLNLVMNDRYHQHLQNMMISENIRDTGVHQTVNCDDDRDTIPGEHGRF